MKKRKQRAKKTTIKVGRRTGEPKALFCKVCNRLVENCDSEAVKITCWRCVHQVCASQMPLSAFYTSLNKKKSGRPPGWHFMKEFVDKKGNVFHKGKEQPELKNSLPPTVVKPREKKKKLTADEKLQRDIRSWKKRKSFRRKNS